MTLRSSLARVWQLSLVLGLLVPALGCSEEPQPLPEVWQEPPSWVLVWRDDFDGPAQSAPDDTHWNVEKHEHGYNDELDYDTTERRNSYQDGEGRLVLQALAENYVDERGVPSEQPYTSARLNTQGKVEQQFGKFEARIKLPQGGRGVWPAFWLLGNNLEAAGWPECGEVDILEWRGSKPNRTTSSLHGPKYSGTDAYHRDYDLEASFSDDFHVFTFEWTADGARFLVDGDPFFVRSVEGFAQTGRTWVYDHPFFIILNLAIGGIFDGNPDATTPFPQQMLVDYVSVSRPGP